MATNLHSSNENTTEEEEEYYIDRDTSFLCSPPHPREFEFHLSSNPPQREETTPSPADEHFYKGKLLPLHLPPRLRMVQSLTVCVKDDVPDSNTVSGEWNPEVYFRESNGKKKWSEKLDLMRKSSMGLKYIKSLFTKSNELNPNTLVRSIERESMMEEDCNRRKSFSGAFNWFSITKSSPCSSSSSSFSSVSSEMESPIEGAIAHCKKSQRPARKSTVSDVGYGSVTAASKIVVACEIKERPKHCRG